MSSLSNAAKSLRDIKSLRLRVWAPSAEMRELLSMRGDIEVAGQHYRYADFLACSFDPSDPPISVQLGLAGSIVDEQRTAVAAVAAELLDKTGLSGGQVARIVSEHRSNDI